MCALKSSHLQAVCTPCRRLVDGHLVAGKRGSEGSSDLPTCPPGTHAFRPGHRAGWSLAPSEWGVRGPRGRSHPVFPRSRRKDGRDVCVGSSLSETDAAGTISGPRAHREEPVARACAAAGTPESRPEPWARGSQKREFSPYQEVTAESAVKRVTSVNRVCSKYYHIHRYQHGNRCERETLHPF